MGDLMALERRPGLMVSDIRESFMVVDLSEKVLKSLLKAKKRKAIGSVESFSRVRHRKALLKSKEVSLNMQK